MIYRGRFVEGTDEHLMKSSWKAGSDSLLLGPKIGKGKFVGSFGTLDESYSVSVSVSSAACRLNPLTGFRRTKDTYSAKRLLAGKVHIFHRSTCWFGLGALL